MNERMYAIFVDRQMCRDGGTGYVVDSTPQLKRSGAPVWSIWAEPSAMGLERATKFEGSAAVLYWIQRAAIAYGHPISFNVRRVEQKMHWELV